jgi:hypothetical protein
LYVWISPPSKVRIQYPARFTSKTEGQEEVLPPLHHSEIENQNDFAALQETMTRYLIEIDKDPEMKPDLLSSTAARVS